MGRNKVKKEDCNPLVVMTVFITCFVLLLGCLVHKVYKSSQIPEHGECYSSVSGAEQYRIDSIYNGIYLDFIVTNGIEKKVVRNYSTEAFLQSSVKQDTCSLFQAFSILSRRADKEE